MGIVQMTTTHLKDYLVMCEGDFPSHYSPVENR